MEMLHKIGIGGDKFVFIHKGWAPENGALDLSNCTVF
jgi:hypothetical protein